MDDIFYAVAHRPQAQIDSFKTRYQDFNSQLIPTIFKSSLGLTATSWQPSESWGTSHVIYFVNTREQAKPLVLRANTGFGSPETVMLTEKLITDLIITHRLPTNKILHVDVSRSQFPFDYQIQEILPGQDPEKYFSSNQDDYDQISFELGQYIAQLATIKLPLFGRLDPESTLKNQLIGTKHNFYDYIIVCLEEDLQFLVDHRVISINVADEILKIFEQHQSIINLNQGSLVHHDLADHNITFVKNHLASVFDWEAAVIGDPILDLASCPTWTTIYPREEKLTAGFCSILSKPDNFEAKINIYRLRTMIWKIRFAIQAQILNDDRMAKFTHSLEPFKLSL